MQLRTLVVAATLIAPLIAAADDAPPPPQDVWTGKGQAGYTSTQGNTDAKSANVALDMSYLDGPWKHTAHVDGLYGESAGVVAAERWDAAWQTNYDLTQDLYVFGALNFTHDMFSGFVYQASVTSGVGYKLLNSTTTQLDVQVGAGYMKLRPEDLAPSPIGNGTYERTVLPTEANAIGTFGIDYSQQLTSTTTLTDKLQVQAGSADTLTNNALAVAVKVSTKLALSVGYTLQDNTNPPYGLKKVNAFETLNLVYAF